MLKAIKQYLLKPSLFILFITIICKTIFLISNWSLIKNESLTHILQSFKKSFSLDIAVIAYISIIPVLILFFQFIFKQKHIAYQVIIGYYTFISFLTLTINFIDIKLFGYWGSKTSAKALQFLNTPEFALKSAGKTSVFIMLLVIFLLSILFYFLLKKIIKKVSLEIFKNIKSLLFFPILIAFIILGLRGGLREIPINQSDAYYSSNLVLNVAGVNSFWNFGNVIFQNNNSLKNNPYKTMTDGKANEIFSQLYQTKKDTTIQLFNTERPNIVYIALEGVNANCIQEFNANNNYMPNVSKIMTEGYTFKNMYASGMRTDQGLVAVISGFPALPLHTIGAQPEKFQHLPSLSLALKAEGYNNQFFFAGEPEFGSFKAFLIHNGFEKVYGLNDYKKSELTQELGAPDEVLFNRFVKDMQNPKEPFFTLMLTQTTHEPFDMPFNKNVSYEGDKYINTVKYVDEQIGKWYQECKKLAWFDNTIFIISSDHAHLYPEEYWYTDKERYHIPFIIFGKPLKEEFKGKTNNGIFNQTDIAYSLSKQLNLPEQKFEFSKNIMNPYSPQFSSYIHIHGNNWVGVNEFCEVNYAIKNDFNYTNDSCVLRNAAYFQYVFKTYMDY